MANPPVAEIANHILAAPLPGDMTTRIVGIDGCGGAGKSTMAAALSPHLPDTVIVHTDDFAAWDNPINWWPRLMEQVLIPLQTNRPGRYQRYDWVARRLAEWRDVPTGGTVIIEGVAATRREFRTGLAFAIFVDTPRDLRLRRGLDRDGPEALDQWRDWMHEEDAYLADHAPETHADLRLAGNLPYV